MREEFLIIFLWFVQVDPSGEIVVFKTGGCPWKDHLFNLEAELDINPPIKYVLYTDQANKWRIQCVPESLVSFSNRYTYLKLYEGCPKSSWTHLILFKITAPLSGKYYNILI